MKKALLLTLIFVVVAAGTAFAGISGSKHDLTSAGSGALTSNIAEICVFCHTPHAGNTGMIGAPLWNRNTGSTTWGNANGYTSTTMNGSSATPSNAIAISQACLGCHDGNVGDEVLLNGSGSGNLNDNIAANFNNGTGIFTTVANLNDASAGLTNDHPIGINMANVALADTEILSAPSDTRLRLFGASNAFIECATCHDVHNGTTDQPFLSMSNAGSAMCRACHNK